MILSSFALAAQLPALPQVEIAPHAWARPGFTWIADDPSSPTTQDGFTLEARAGLDVAMPVAQDVRLGTKIELALLPEPVLTDALITLEYKNLATVRLGQMKVPFSVHRMASDTRRVLVPNVRTFDSITREIGADATVFVPIAGKSRASVSSGVYNGEGANRIQNVNQRFQLVERGLITPFGPRSSVFEGANQQELYVGLGGGWMYDFAGDGEGASETNTFGLDLQVAWNGVSLQAEAMDHEVVNANVSVADYHIQGAYAQLASFIPWKPVAGRVELAARYEIVDPNTAFGDTAEDSLPDFQATQRITGGINVYVFNDGTARYHDLKVQTAYTHIEALEGTELPDDLFSANVTARF